MSTKYIALLLAVSLIISIIYYFGYRKNVKIIKSIAVALEDALKPKDKLYTYLGGVLGFSVEYKVDGVKKVLANLRLIPRQSVLYLPFMFITSGKDNLQLLFYTKKPLRCEFHLVRKSPLNLTKPKIYNRDKLKKEPFILKDTKFDMLYESENYDRKFLQIAKLLPIKYFNHLAITTDNNIIYVQLLFYNIDMETLKESIKQIKEFITKNYS